MRKAIVLALLIGCGGQYGAPLGGGSGGAGGGAGAGASGGGQGGGPQPGTLTAGAWDDNANFDFYRHYLAMIEQQQMPGLPLVPRADRLTIGVVDGSNQPLAGATVTVSSSASVRFTSTTGAEGRVLFFPTWSNLQAGEVLTVSAEVSGQRTTTTLHAGDASVTVPITTVQAARPAALDVAFVIDTTGSMGDEMQYLKVEFGAIVGALAQRFPGVGIRWALVLYRDEGDEYEVRTFDFTSDTTLYGNNLGAQTADGGGDYPEEPEKGLQAAGQLAWRTGATARVLFHVADAPHHAGREGALLSALRTLQTQGVHIYPIASSGVDDLFEYTFRTAAELTGGRYLFLTDDSGVGLPHKEPTIPCYFVTHLDKAILRVIGIELTGVYTEPAAEDIVRTSGSPQDGMCTLSDGSQVHAF